MASHTGLIARLIGAVLLACVATAAHAEKRVALVIGNSAYQDCRQNCPIQRPTPG